MVKLKATTDDQALRATQVSPNDWICSSCGSVGEYRRIRPGSDVIELVLWLCGIVPGLIYSSWRNSKKTTACTHCAAMTMIAVGSPVGRELLARTSPNIQIVASAAPRQPQMTTGERVVAQAGRIAIWILIAMLAVPAIFSLLAAVVS